MLNLKRFDDIGRINWVTKVREILFQYGFGYVWLWQDVGDIYIFTVQFNPLPDAKVSQTRPAST